MRAEIVKRAVGHEAEYVDSVSCVICGSMKNVWIDLDREIPRRLCTMCRRAVDVLRAKKIPRRTIRALVRYWERRREERKR